MLAAVIAALFLILRLSLLLLFGRLRLVFLFCWFRRWLLFFRFGLLLLFCRLGLRLLLFRLSLGFLLLFCRFGLLLLCGFCFLLFSGLGRFVVVLFLHEGWGYCSQQQEHGCCAYDFEYFHECCLHYRMLMAFSPGAICHLL